MAMSSATDAGHLDWTQGQLPIPLAQHDLRFRPVGHRCHARTVAALAREYGDLTVAVLRVPRSEFADLWASAENVMRQRVECGEKDWYVGAVVATCRWLARSCAARSPATWRPVLASEELVVEELLAAELLPSRRPRLIRAQPGWCEGIVATLRWAWQRSAPPPLPKPDTSNGYDTTASSSS